MSNNIDNSPLTKMLKRRSIRIKSKKISLILSLAIFLFHGVISYAQNNDKEIYKTIKINNQVWMPENLNVGNFRNGDSVPEAKTDEEWVSA